MKVVMGPFAELAAGLKRSAFFTRDGALVPRTELHLENARIYNIFIFRGDYYVVYETERLDFYKPYLARLPPPGERKEVEELRLPRCPRCGSWDVHVYADEMLCSSCSFSDFWHTDVVWRARDLPPEGLIEGEGIYIVANAVREYQSLAGHAVVEEVRRLAEGEERLGNLSASWAEFYGYIDESHWDEEPTCYGFAVYRRYTVRFEDGEKQFTVKVRDLTEGEVEELFDALRDDFAKLCLTRFLPRERAVELTLRARLHEKYPLHSLVDDPRVREAYINHHLQLMRRAVEKGDLKDAAYYASLLRSADYESEETRRVLAEYERVREEERRRREEERRAKMREIRSRFAGLPVEVRESFDGIEVRLAKRVGKDEFSMFVKICRELGFRYDWKSKSWFFKRG